MTRIKNTGILYTSGEKTRKFYTGSMFPIQGEPINPYKTNLFPAADKQFDSDGLPKTKFNADTFSNNFGGYNKMLRTSASDYNPGRISKPVKPKLPSDTSNITELNSNVAELGKQQSANALKTINKTNKLTNTVDSVRNPVDYSQLSAIGAAGGQALEGVDDKNAETYTTKEKAGDISGSALKGASTGLSTATSLAMVAPKLTASIAAAMGFGSSLGPIGAAVGLLAGIGMGIGKAKKHKKEAKKVETTNNRIAANKTHEQNLQSILGQDEMLKKAPTDTYNTSTEKYGYSRRGGIFKRITIPKSTDESSLKK